MNRSDHGPKIGLVLPSPIRIKSNLDKENRRSPTVHRDPSAMRSLGEEEAVEYMGRR